MSKCEHGIKLNRTCLSCVQIERSAMVAITEPERDVLERRVKATYETLVKAGFPHSAKAMADAIAEIKRLRKHDCENWSMEGIACARCNPIARELRAKFGNLDNRDAEPQEQGGVTP